MVLFPCHRYRSRSFLMNFQAVSTHSPTGFPAFRQYIFISSSMFLTELANRNSVKSVNVGVKLNSDKQSLDSKTNIFEIFPLSMLE